MELVCPLCNAMDNYIYLCPSCHTPMENTGAIQDYFDDYSTYLPMDITQRIDDAPHEQCVHLFYCNRCHYDKRIGIRRIVM
ncbi:MAG: hypothetical protein AB2421_12865 [Thermotaleaceae bacterium]